MGSDQFRTDPGGYGQLVAWMASWGRVSRVGVEGTGSYGAGLARYLCAADIEVVEVNRPNRQLRRRRGKDDHTDAEAAARAVLSGEATAVPKSGDGPVEWIRMLTLTRRSAIKARTQAANQIHSVLVSAPEPLKAQLRGMNLKARVPVCARFSTQRRVLCQLRQTGSSSSSPPLPGPRHRDRRTRRRDSSSLRQGQPGSVGHPRRRSRHSRHAASRSWRQPEAYEIGTILRCVMRPQPCPGVVRANSTASPQPRRQPPSQQRTMADRYQPYAYRRRHQRIRGQTPSRGQEANRDHPLPETAHRPRNLPPPHRPATNPELHEATQPATTTRNHRHPGRPNSRNQPQPHLSTRARPRPQPPTRYPIPDVAPNPRTGPVIDLTNIGASWVEGGEILGPARKRGLRGVKSLEWG